LIENLLINGHTVQIITHLLIMKTRYNIKTNQNPQITPFKKNEVTPQSFVCPETQANQPY